MLHIQISKKYSRKPVLSFAFDVSVSTLLPQRTLLSDHGPNDFMTES